MASKEKDKLYQ